MNLGLLILGAAIFFFLWQASKLVDSKAKSIEPEEKQTNCPPHKWNYEQDYMDQEIMICKKCRRRPSYEGRE